MLAWVIPSEEEENEVKPSGEQNKPVCFLSQGAVYLGTTTDE